MIASGSVLSPAEKPWELAHAHPKPIKVPQDFLHRIKQEIDATSILADLLASIRDRKYSPKIYFAVGLAIVMVSLSLILLWYIMQSTSTR